MDAITLPIYSSEGKEVGSVALNPSVFDGEVNQDVLYQAVNAFRANQRKGLASTKTRGEVSGGGKKPWRQKGTGRARVGSIRSPLWRHGGVVFGPHPRDFYLRLPSKIKKAALKSSLNVKVKDNNFIILDKISLSAQKTKEAAKIFSSLKADPRKEKKSYKVLLLVDKTETGNNLALRNIGFLNTNITAKTHAYEILANHKIVITQEGLKSLTERINKK